MKISIYALCYNEEFMLPFFFQHYKKLSENITIFDNMSSDGSLQIMRDNGAKIIPFDTGGRIRDDKMLEIKSNCWHGSKSDWVIVVDVDEFLYHPNLIEHLNRTDCTVLKPQGYQMLGRTLPKHGKSIYEQMRTGVADHLYSKMCAFRPDQISDIGYQPGCHVAKPTGTVLINNEVKLLHYNYLTLEWHLKRYFERGRRLSDKNVKEKWGIEYLQGANQRKTIFNRLLSKSETIL